MNRVFTLLTFISTAAVSFAAEKPLTAYVNPFLGTAPLTNVADIGFVPPWRVWAGLTFPGASLPNSMVQLSPITEFGSGAGYEYEDTVIHAFTHSNKGHWNLCHIPILPVTGEVNPDDFTRHWKQQRTRVRNVRVAQRGTVLYEAELGNYEAASTAPAREDPDGLDPPILPSGPACQAEIPRSIRMQVPNTDDDVIIQYKSVVWNPPMLEGTFSQPVPGGVRRQFADCD